MKRGTPRHPKTKRLARKLNQPFLTVVGILEMLWHYTAEFAPQGDIGRFPNEEIADGIGWENDADELVNALIEAGWLDENPTYRLVVHDWAEHAEDSVKKRLTRNGLTFAVLPSGNHVQTESGHGSTISGHVQTISATQVNHGAPRAGRRRRQGLGEGGGNGGGSSPEGKGSGETQNGFASFEGPPENHPDYWAKRLYDRHPKRKDFALVEQWVAAAWLRFENPRLKFEAIDGVHVLWCETPDWRKENGRYCPSLPRWLEDRGYEAKPRSAKEPDDGYVDPYTTVRSKMTAWNLKGEDLDE